MAATRSVLGGSSIVEGGYKRSVSPAAWERWIGDVGGEMGFAGVGRVLSWWIRYMQSWKWVEVRLSERKEEKGENPPVWRGKQRHCSSECGWTSDQHWRVGWSSVSLSLMCGVELKSLVSWSVWSEEFRKCFESKITLAIVLRVWGFYFMVNANVFYLTKFFMRNQTHRRV